MSIARITDDSTREDIEEALVNHAKYAAHQLHHPDNSKWVRAHERIDALLGDWEAAQDLAARTPSITP